MPELGFGTTRQEAEKIRNRLLRRSVDLRCFECGKGGRTRIAELGDRLECPECGSKFMTIPSGSEERLVLELKTSRGKIHSRDVLSKLKWKADLLAIYGGKGAMALSVRGIGPQTASRILSKMHDDDDEFIADLVRASGRYEATKQYWAS
jgi:ATP-dependent Lhr-like helicase